MICIAAGSTLIALAGPVFTLGWTHSVTHTQWHEAWQAGPEGLRPIEAFIQGPGAGMELPDGATRIDQGWTFRPDLPPQSEVFLAASGTTDGGWTICAEGQCHEVGREPGQAVRLWWAEECDPPAPRG